MILIGYPASVPYVLRPGPKLVHSLHLLRAPPRGLRLRAPAGRPPIVSPRRVGGLPNVRAGAWHPARESACIVCIIDALSSDPAKNGKPTNQRTEKNIGLTCRLRGEDPRTACPPVCGCRGSARLCSVRSLEITRSVDERRDAVLNRKDARRRLALPPRRARRPTRPSRPQRGRWL